MNILDAVIYAAGIVAIISGYRAGLFRSLATIVGYVAAGPIAVAASSIITPAMANQSPPPWAQNSILFFGIFLVAGMVLGHLFRTAIGDFLGTDVHVADRISGALLGALRVVLVGATFILICDRIIPLERQPAFLKESTVRPALSAIGQSGLKSLPADLTDYLDRLKREQAPPMRA